MGGQILLFLVDTVAGFFCVALLARFTLQVVRAPQYVWRNPLGQFVMAVTDWQLLPVRRFVPGWRGYDTASLLLAVAWQLLNVLVATSLTLLGMSLGPLALLGLLLLALLATAKVWLYLLMGVVLIAAIFSWVNPHAPMADLFNRLSAPWLRPFQRHVPPVGGIDLSPLLLIVLIQVALMLLGGLRLSVFPLLFAG